METTQENIGVIPLIKYIELDGKVPKHNFDTFSTSHEKYKDAGIILNNKVVVVDFDHAAEVGEAIFRLFPTLKVTSGRGIHLYYRRPTDESMMSIGNLLMKLKCCH